jgi:hypothetical protein
LGTTIFASAAIIVALSFFSFPFMRRAKQKLETILALQKTLMKQKEGPATGRVSSAQLSPSEYEEIARIETTQIIEDRARSIGLAQNEPPDATYLIQNSKEMLSGKHQLDLETRTRVETAIFQLSTDPSPPDAVKDSETGVLRLPVPETSVEIVYHIDEEQRRIFLLSLNRSNASEKVDV